MKDDGTSADPKVMIAGVCLLLLAFVSWELRNFVPALAAKSVTATAELSTIGEADDARIFRTFASIPQTRKSDAKLEPQPNSSRQIRHTLLSTQAPTEAEALENLERTLAGIRTAYATEGGGELHINASKKTTPVTNAAMETLSSLMRGGALLLTLAGVGALFSFWRRLRAKMGADMPATDPMARAGIIYLSLILIFALPLHRVTLPGLPPPMNESSSWVLLLLIMAIPFFIVYALIRKLREVKEAAHWSVGRARITKSQVGAQRHRFAGEATQIKNLPQVEYEFNVGNETCHGDRIGIGDTAAGSVEMEATLQRYPVGANVPVYYDPNAPQNCVLEREAPANAGCLFAFAFGVVLAGLALAAFFLFPEGPLLWLDARFPAGAHPVFAIFFAVAGLMTLMSLWGARVMAAKAKRWPVASGHIVASTTESYFTNSTSRGARTRVYEPVVEYAYQVNGREYHSAQLSFGGKVATGSQAPADAVIARYPVDTVVEVRYDPQNPSVAVLETKVAFARLGLIFVLVFFIAAAFFGGAF